MRCEGVFCLFRRSLLSEAARRFIIGREDSGAERERLPAVPQIYSEEALSHHEQSGKNRGHSRFSGDTVRLAPARRRVQPRPGDDSATVSLKGDILRVFVNCGKSFQSMDSTDLGDALRIIMTARYMQRIDGKLEDTSEAKEWIE